MRLAPSVSFSLWVAAAAPSVAACSGGSSPSSAGMVGQDGGAPATDGATGNDGSPGAQGADATGSQTGDGAADAVVPDAFSCVAPPTPDAGTCNALTVTGSPVPIQCAGAQTPPTPAGGAIADGTYVLVSSTYYGTCPASEQDRITWSICGGAWQTAQEGTTNGKTTLQLLDAVVSTSNNTLSIRLTCGGMQSPTFGYDASPTMLTLFTWAPTSAPNGRVDVFRKL